MRIVFDASAKLREGAILNDKHRYSSHNRKPVFLPQLISILLRWHTFPTVTVADVEKAFLQVSLNKATEMLRAFCGWGFTVTSCRKQRGDLSIDSSSFWRHFESIPFSCDNETSFKTAEYCSVCPHFGKSVGGQHDSISRRYGRCGTEI
ncbi:unnamed protein product [Gongylonema pulchrum]|uniref:Reverse transcriptase domain-containing protein n=1 Tax=Gongylonema pulchrum TaxID=637853 RepID=A0A183DUW6_9BILA|nr:unnamed protein product [Gongylonema pulchrum]